MSNPPHHPEDFQHMHSALRLARRGLGRVEPNPMVGCVIVKGGRVVGEGYHRRFGGDHAEIMALRKAGSRAKGATVYVTLEPCNHHGKTPPCTDALLSARVARVVAAMRDPNPLVAGRGLRTLRRRGLRVAVGLLARQGELLNAPYIKLITQRLPYVIVKWAQSLDGKIATRTGDARWITGPQSLRQVHRLRARADAIIVGSETLLRDDPQLTCRGVVTKRVARRIVLDTRLRTPLQAKVVVGAARIPTTIFTSRSSAQTRQAARLRSAGVAVETAALRGGSVSLKLVLKNLARQGMTNVLIEGGGRVLGSAFDLGVVDEAFIFVAPILIGGRQAPAALGGDGIRRLKQSVRLQDLTTRRSGSDLLYRFRL